MSEPEIELLHASLDGGYRTLRWQLGDIAVCDGVAFIVELVEDDGTATGKARWSKEKPSMAEVERRRTLRREYSKDWSMHER